MALIRCDFLVPGNYFCDVIFTGFPQFPAFGTEVYTKGLTVTVGGVLNTVIALQRLGSSVGWLGIAGSDFFSRFALETLTAEGVDLSLIRRIDTQFQRITVAISYPHERAFVTYVDPAPTSIQMTLDALDQQQIEFKHLHFTGFQTDPRTVELLERAQSLGAVASMDCQDRPITLESPGVRETLTRLAIFMPNAQEAKKLTGTETIEAAADILRPLVPVLVIKDGANGAAAWQANQAWHVPAIPITPVDTTGAGDVFNAGFLTAYQKGLPIPNCLRWGNICGGLSTLSSGGGTSAPRRDDVERYLQDWQP